MSLHSPNMFIVFMQQFNVVRIYLVTPNNSSIISQTTRTHRRLDCSEEVQQIPRRNKEAAGHHHESGEPEDDARVRHCQCGGDQGPGPHE